MAEWYYIESGQTRGPVDDEAIRVLASVGRLNAASQLMQSGSSQWSTLGAFEAQLGLQRSATGGYGATGAAATAAAPARLRAPCRGTGHLMHSATGATTWLPDTDPPAAVTAVQSHRVAWWKRAGFSSSTIILSIPISILLHPVVRFEARAVDVRPFGGTAVASSSASSSKPAHRCSSGGGSGPTIGRYGDPGPVPDRHRRSMASAAGSGAADDLPVHVRVRAPALARLPVAPVGSAPSGVARQSRAQRRRGRRVAHVGKHGRRGARSSVRSPR